MFVIGLIASGIYQFQKLPIDAVPDITNNQVLVITSAPAYGATDIERLVTFPIEQANTNIPGITEIRSFSRFGLSLVTIIFNDATDVYWARQQVSERLSIVQQSLPPGMGKPELGPVSTGLGEIYQYVVRARAGFESKYSVTDLRTIQDWIIKRQLISVPGVAEVSSFGGKLKQYHIIVDPYKLQSYGITINDVFDALEKNNQNTGGAYIEKGPTAVFIRSEGLIKDISDLSWIRIRPETKSTPVFLRDIAEIKIGYATRFGAIQYNDQGEVAGAVVMMLKGANSNQVIKNIKDRIHEIQKTLPDGVIIEAFLDRTKMVNNAINTVKNNLIEGALIVVFILVLFLGNLRAGLLVATVIPLSLLFAVIMMNTFGVSGNLMSLGALDFGLIVDGAIIIVEAVMHRMHTLRSADKNVLSDHEMDHEVLGTTSKMMNSAVFGQLIILLVYIPIFSLEGIEGKMFKPMAQTVAFALLGAFILSLTYIPMMSTWVLSKKIHTGDTWSDKIMYRIENAHAILLSKLIKIPRYVIMTTFIVFVLAIIVLSRLGGEFIPQLEEGDFAVDTRVLNGSNLHTTMDYTSKAAGLLKSRFSEVEKVVTKIGAGEVPTDPMSMEASDMMIILKNKKEWIHAKTFDQLAEKMGQTLNELPGISYGFQYPVQMRFNELMTGAKQDVVCKIFGENLDTLAHYASELGKIISGIKGQDGLYIEPITGRSQIVINFDRHLMAQYGIHVEEANRIINMSYAGQTAGTLYEDEKRFDIVVKTGSKDHDQLLAIENLLVSTPSGMQIPIKQFAQVKNVLGPNQIQREDAKRRIMVGFNVVGRDVQTIVHELQDKVSASVRLPAGYYIRYGGTFENIEAAKKRLLVAVPVSLLLIFLMLYFAFNSIKQGLLIYTAIPLSAIGGIFLLAIRGMPFSISAGIGFIALFGVSVLNGIVLITEFNKLKLSSQMDITKIIIQGTKNRLRPVLMTASVASLGFLPMALSHGAGAEVQRPLATVVIGGLLVATFLTLIVLPILYMLFENIKKKPVLISLLLLLLGNIDDVHAQNKIDLQTLIDKVLNQNLQIKNEVSKTKYYDALIQTSSLTPATQFALEYGEINSAYKDNAFSVFQNVYNPRYTKSLKSLFLEQATTSRIDVDAKKALIIKEASEAFYTLVYSDEKIRTINSIDSILDQLIANERKRLQSGETNKMPLLIANNQKMSLLIKKKEIDKLLTKASLVIQKLTNESEKIIPIYHSPKLNLTLPDSFSLMNHPYLAYFYHRIAEHTSQIALDKSLMLPTYGIGVTTTTMKGIGADEIRYTNDRFFKVQFNIGIPIFNKSYKAKLQADQMYQSVLENDLTIETQKIQNQLDDLLQEYQKTQEIIDQYEQSLLPNIQESSNLINAQYQQGEINSVERMYLAYPWWDHRLAYIDAVHEANNQIIAIHYLLTQIK